MAKEVNKRVNIWLNQQGIENNLKSIRSAITQTANELNKLPIGSEEWYKKSEKLARLKSIFADAKKEIGATSKELEYASEKSRNFMMAAGGVATVLQTASSALRRFVSSTQEYVDAYATLDDAMTNVSKYTGLTREEVKQLNEEFRKMDTRTPTEKLNALAADAGRLGITSKEAIKDFVEAADIINVALGEDLGEDAVKEIGKLAEMFGTTETMGLRGAMLATGSAINTLAQSSSASERYLMDFTSRLAGAANQAQISQANILGFASVLDQNKQQVEMSATALQKLLMNMFTAPEKYAHLAGMSVKEFANALKNDANEALITFLDTLNKKGGLSELAPIFKDLGLDGARASGVISVLAGKIDDVREAQATANAAFAEGNSVINEAAAVNGNAAAQLDKAKKAVQDAKAALGEELLPVITKLTQQSSNGIKVVSEVVKWMKEHQSLIKTLAAAYGILYLAHMKNVHAKELSAKWDGIVKSGDSAGTVVTSLFALAKAKLAKNTLAAANAQKALKVAFAATPWGAVITAVLALAGAFSFFRSKTDEAKEAQKDLTVEIEQQYNTEKKKIEELRKIIESENTSREQKLNAINKLKEIIPGYVAELDKEGKVVDNNRKAIDDYLKSLKNKIRYEGLANALTQAQNKQIELESNVGFLKGKAKNGNFLNAFWMEIKNDIGKAQEAVDQNKQYISSLMNEMEEMDLELIGKTGKNYTETYQTFNDSILQSFENNSGSNTTADKKTLTARENFLKKLQQMEAKAQADTLSGWEKTKQEIVNKYEELLTEAEELYGKDSEEFKKVQDLKAQELSNTLGKYLKTLTDASDKMMTEAKKMLDESDPDNKETPLIKAVFGEQQKWNEKMQAVRTNIANLDEIIDEMKPGDEGWEDLLSTRQTLFEQLLTLQQDNAQAISNVIRQHTQSDTDFIKDQEEKLARARMSDHGRQVAEINELYNTKIEAKKKEIAALEKLLKENPENADIAKQIEELKKLIEQLETLQGKEIAAVPQSGGQKSVWQQLAEFDWSKMRENWQSALNLMSQGLQEFANAAFDILSSISQMQADRDQAELDRFVAAQDEKSKALQRQLDDGLISQKYYNAQLLKMEREKEAKEKKMKHDQFERDRAASIAKALIEGGLAVAMAFSQYGWPWGLIPAALSTAQTAAQTAMIAAQVNPYAKGSYIRGPQLALMGEEGDEWVASNKLLRDKKTASIIEALDQYQKGNRSALAGITFAAPDPKSLSQAARANGGTFAPSNQTTNNYYQHTDNPELLYEIRMLRKYMEDPNNRRAYISRRMQLDFETNENELKELARL